LPRIEKGEASRRVEKRKFKVDFFSFAVKVRLSRKRKHAKFRENLDFRLCVPHFDPRVHRRDATRCDAMCSIIEIDHAEGGVGGGRRGDWSHIDDSFHAKKRQDFDFLLGLSWFQASIFFLLEEFYREEFYNRFITFQIRIDCAFSFYLLHSILYFVLSFTPYRFLPFILLDNFSWRETFRDVASGNVVQDRDLEIRLFHLSRSDGGKIASRFQGGNDKN